MIGSIDVLYIVQFIVVLIASLTVHEFTHAFVGHQLGDATAREEGRLSLNPLRHIDPLLTVALPIGMIILGQPPILIAKPVPFDPQNVRHGDYGAALIAVSGPLSNLALAIVCASVWQFLPDSSSDIVLLFVQLNVSFFVFNMLPIPPLDGSRLLYAFAPERLQRVMERIESMGLVFVLLAVLLLSPVLGPLLANINSTILHLLLR